MLFQVVAFRVLPWQLLMSVIFFLTRKWKKHGTNLGYKRYKLKMLSEGLHKVTFFRDNEDGKLEMYGTDTKYRKAYVKTERWK